MTLVCLLVDCTRWGEYSFPLFEACLWLVCMLACVRLPVTLRLSWDTLKANFCLNMHMTNLIIFSFWFCRDRLKLTQILQVGKPLKVARNEVENASFAQRSAHRDSRIWRPELIEPAAERKRRARGRRPTFNAAFPDPQILPQCNISSNYPL